MGQLFLIPTTLGETAMHTIPPYVVNVIHQTTIFIAERAKTARHFIKATAPPYPLSSTQVLELAPDGTLPKSDLEVVETALKAGLPVGLMSEAGCPGVADPGAQVVQWAHQKGLKVVPLVGPSALLLALMASGFNGQGFTFQGYISAKKGDLAKDLRRLEDIARRTHQTQIFIETPYRNKQVFDTALSVLAPDTRFCVAADLTLPSEWIQAHKISAWRQLPPMADGKRPAIFLIHVGR